MMVRRHVVAVGLALLALPLLADGNAFRAEDYADFRRELRAFYPNECHQACKDPRQTNSVAEIGRELDDWAKAHPGYDALDIRRECYLSIRRHVQPFLFKTSPFYFELGCNGGWTHNCRTVPGRHVNRLCQRFYKEQNLIPDEAFALQKSRTQLTLALCCGPFVDDMHHVPPFRTILRKGFKGVRDEVAAALEKCPKGDPIGRKELETALAQGFSPSEYRCKSDVTTVINAIGSFPHECLYASNANLTFDSTAMNDKYLAAVLRVYCQKGAHMIQPNCNSVEELLDAQKHPERHQDLIVRVCGFSARFIALSKRWQDEVIARHRLK